MKTSQVLGIGIALAAAMVVGTMAGCAHDDAAAGGTNTAASASATTGGGATDGKAQASAGGALYGQYCANCHGAGGEGTQGAPAVVGKEALPLDPPATAKYRKSQFKTARDVYDFTKANMPAKAPGSLTEEQYLNIIAFDLQANGVDLTGKTITPDTLSTIVLHP